MRALDFDLLADEHRLNDVMVDMLIAYVNPIAPWGRESDNPDV